MTCVKRRATGCGINMFEEAGILIVSYCSFCSCRGIITNFFLFFFFFGNPALSRGSVGSQVTAHLDPAGRRSSVSGSIALAHVSPLYSISQTTPPLSPQKYPFRELSVTLVLIYRVRAKERYINISELLGNRVFSTSLRLELVARLLVVLRGR